MRELAAETGLTTKWLRHRLPAELHTDIRERRQAWVSAERDARRGSAIELVASITADLLRSGQTASRRQVEARLPSPLSLREPALQMAWRECRAEAAAGALGRDVRKLPSDARTVASVTARPPLVARFRPRKPARGGCRPLRA